MNNETGEDMEESGHCLIVVYCPGIYLQRLTMSANNLSWDSWSLVQDFNPTPLEYETGVLLTGP